jgi:NAD(P)-dependent dehydrogenase (short-subunit alcohol dehydrogenase family)
MLDTPSQPILKTVVITGASSGIGAATAILFSKHGYDVLLLGRNHSKLEEVRLKCNPRVQSINLAFDLNEVEKYKDELLAALDKLSPLYCLVNNAGIFQSASIEKEGLDEWYTQFELNLFSAVKLNKIVWPILKKSKGSSIVNISSTLGLKPTSSTAAYSASKAAMINYSIALAQAGAPFYIRVNCICPGIVDTPIHGYKNLPVDEANKVISQLNQLQPLNRIGKPEEVANAIYFLGSENSSWTTGSILSVDGGINILNG